MTWNATSLAFSLISFLTIPAVCNSEVIRLTCGSSEFTSKFQLEFDTELNTARYSANAPVPASFGENYITWAIVKDDSAIAYIFSRETGEFAFAVADSFPRVNAGGVPTMQCFRGL